MPPTDHLQTADFPRRPQLRHCHRYRAVGDPAVFQDVPKASSAVIVSNTTVALLYRATPGPLAGRPVCRGPGRVARRRSLQELGRSFEHDLRTPLLGHGCDRKTVLFVLGGGVVAT